MKIGIFLLLILILACNQQPSKVIFPWVPYDEIWKNVSNQISNFSEEDYQTLKPLILEQDIPTLQSHILSGQLSYEKLTQWYLYRIVKYENDQTEFY